MPILEYNVTFAGQNEAVKPRFAHIHTTDTLATVVGAGYLNNYFANNGGNSLPSDFVFVAASDGHQIYKPVFNGHSFYHSYRIAVGLRDARNRTSGH